MNAPWTTFRHDALRLETRPVYLTAADDEGRKAFDEGRPLPISPALEAWEAWVLDGRQAGRRVWRCHVVDLPLTDYQRYELAQYERAVRHGEEIWIARRDASPALEELREDFWGFDLDHEGATALQMRYDDAGHYLGQVAVTDPAILSRYRAARDLALRWAVSLLAFIATAA